MVLSLKLALPDERNAWVGCAEIVSTWLINMQPGNSFADRRDYG